MISNQVRVFRMIEYNIEGGLLFQPSSFRFIHQSKEIQLSQKETEVLQLLCHHQQQVVERKTFIQEVWGDKEGADISLNKSILTLRRKFESLGYLDAINTVPRVGYMLRLNVLIIDAPEQEVPQKQPELTSPLPAEGNKSSPRYKRGLSYLNLIVAALLSVLIYRLYALYLGKEATPLAYKVAYESPSLTVFEMANLKQSVNYPVFISLLPSNNRMQVSISNRAISFIGDSDGHRSWSKVFMLDNNININTQLTCIAHYVEKTSKTIDRDVPLTNTSVTSEQGPAFHKKRFYSPCRDTQPDYIGEAVINSSHHPTDSPAFREPSSLIQNIFFYDKNSEPVFHFTSVARVNHLHEGKSKLDFFVHLQNKAIKIATIDQHKIDNNKYLNLIFNEYEADDSFLKSLTSSDDNQVTVLSSVFDGTLSEGIWLVK